MLKRALSCAFLLATTACVGPAATGGESPWPRVESRVRPDAGVEARVDAILARMTLEEKVGQIIQPDIASVTPEDVRRYKFGSVLNGGNSSPGGNETGPATDWLKLADAFWEASMDPATGGEKIPVMWGSDAVHGHSNIVGATLFPHNIGLGATRNPALIRRIGEVTALEMVVTGLDWDFSPTLAVVRDDRWGRTYEGFSEDPEIVRAYSGAMVEGLQGRAGTKEFLGAGKVIATAKHFVGDGGTEGGRDQGDNPSTDAQLSAIHGAGYPPAIKAGVQAVMASFSSVRGEKVHGSHALLTDALKTGMGFDGLVVGDWNGYAQVPGCSLVSCPQSVNAGLDMFMAPDSWKGLYDNTLAQAKSGEIPMARLDDAVRRILRVKIRAGLFEKGKPSTRPYAGRFDLLGSAEHKAVARQAVRESLVLLKNQGKILPLAANARVLVAGDGADDIAKQSGGWTLTWQGTGVTNKDFPNAQSIFSGINEAVRKVGGTATLSADGNYADKPDVAIVVFGENPYAEFVGDRATLEYSPADKKDLALLRKLKAAGIPVVSVFLSGRPLWINPELNASDAFVAAFLPGSEGGGVADLLFRDDQGKARYDFKGKLSYSWPKRVDQAPLNKGDAGYDPLFAYGFGLSYGDDGNLPQLSEERPLGAAPGADGVIFGRGTMPAGWQLTLAEEDGGTATVTGNSGASPAERLNVSGIDRRAQEDARLFTWAGGSAATARIAALQPLDLNPKAGEAKSLVLDYRVDAAPEGAVSIGLGGFMVDVTALLQSAPASAWTSLSIPLSCFSKLGADMRRVAAPFAVTSTGGLALAISDIRLGAPSGTQVQCAGK